MKQNKDIHWWTSPRKLLRTILMLDDTPHRIALGTAIGMFIAMTPTVGVQMILVMIFAFLTQALFQFNRLAALITVYVSNPITMVPLYWFNYQVGKSFFVDSDFTRAQFEQLRDMTWIDALVRLIVEVGEPMFVGSLIVASVSALVTYPAIRWLLHSVGHGGPPPTLDNLEPESNAPAVSAAESRSS